MRQPNYNYRSDWASRKFDRELRRLEGVLTALYNNAAVETQVQFAKYQKRFAVKDSKYRKLVDEGKMPKDAYIEWRKRRIVETALFKATVVSIAKTLVKTDLQAMSIIAANLPYVIAESFNFTQSLGFAAADAAGLSVGTFEVFNVDSVQKILRDNPDLLPHVDFTKDLQWNKDKINQTLTQAIIQGDDMQTVANKLQQVTGMDEQAAIRNARTAMTAAENIGRSESYDDLKKKGIPVKLRWNAVKDARTRESHLLLDGTFRDDKKGVFGIGIIQEPYLRFPSDPRGRPEEIYNCRCRAGIVFEAELIDKSNDDELYKKFMQEKHPDDWAAMQTSEREIRRRAEAEAAKAKQAELRAKRGL